MTGRLAASWVAVLAVGTIGACDRSGAARSDGSDAAPITSPSQTILRARELRQRNAYGELGRYLIPEQRSAVVRHLQAVDRLVVAHESLNQLIAQRIGIGSATLIDPTALGNIAGVFSADVEIVEETVQGDRAVVTISVAGRLPLENVSLTRVDGQWLLATDPPVPDLSVQIHKLADAADRVAQVLRSRPMTAQEVRHELDLRQAPVLKRIRELETVRR
jgi:hypothetical protein